MDPADRACLGPSPWRWPGRRRAPAQRRRGWRPGWRVLPGAAVQGHAPRGALWRPASETDEDKLKRLGRVLQARRIDGGGRSRRRRLDGRIRIRLDGVQRSAHLEGPCGSAHRAGRLPGGVRAQLPDAGRCRAAGWSASRASERAVIVCRTLGPIEVTVDGAPAPSELLWRKHLALLVYLARSPRQTRSREHLIGLLWADRTELGGPHSLSEALRVIRRHAGPRGRRGHGRPGGLDRGAVDLDVGRLEELAAQEDWTAAAELVAGEFLEGFGVPDATGFEDWLAAEREHWRRRGLEVLVRCAERWPARARRSRPRSRGPRPRPRADFGAGVSGGDPEPRARGRPQRRARAVPSASTLAWPSSAPSPARIPGR